MVGTGANLGLGHDVIPIEVSIGGTGPGAAIGVGTYPDAIAITPDGERAYVTNYASNSVTPIDLLSGKVQASIRLGSSAGPAGIAITPDGTTAYVTDAGATGTLGDTITPIDLATDKTLSPITVGPGPQGIAIAPDGLRAYVADAGAIVSGQTGAFGSTVTPVDLLTGRALAPITVGNAPTGIAITPDGSTALVANLNSGSVSPINLANDVAGAPIPVSGAPIAVAVSSTEPTIAYVVDTISKQSATGNVTPVDLTSDTAGAPIGVGRNPQAIAMSPDGKTAWVVCYDSQTIVPLNIRTNRPGKAIHLPGGPSAIAVASRPTSAPTVTTTVPAKRGSSTNKKK
jgi:YVTN family beta-propeller protein